MNQISEAFRVAKSEQRSALVAYLTAGCPSLKGTLLSARAAVEAGADMLEIGVPFSDPLADGKVLQNAAQVALKNNVNVSACLDVVGTLRDSGIKQPILLMGYLNPFNSYGLSRLATDAVRAGVNGFVIPDLPIEHAPMWSDQFQKAGLANISFVAPTTNESRIRQIAEQATGFIYCIAANGVTGPRSEVSDDLGRFLSNIRRITWKPLAVGFGISTPQQAHSVSQVADGVIVGSALMQILLSHSPERGAVELKEFLSRMAQQMNRLPAFS